MLITKKILLPIVALLFSTDIFAQHVTEFHWSPLEVKDEINDWYIFQRMIPYGKVDADALQQAARSICRQKSAVQRTTLAPWQPIGPINIGGRITDVAMPPSSLQTMYVGAASGGIFKSTDAGNSWNPIFDNQPSLSIGDFTIAPSNENILYVGTGEANTGGGSIAYDGAGVFKSLDAGTTWTDIGLNNCRNIGRIAVDPNDANRVFVAAMGDLFGSSTDQGLYHSTDGGATWQQFLFRNDSTGVIDVAIDPLNSNIVYACTWTRVRRIDRRNLGGPDSGLWKSTDGGNTWSRITTTAGLPSGFNYGRTSIGISASNPNTLYYMISNDQSTFQGVYKSTDGGNTWSRTNDIGIGDIFNGAAHWEGRITVDPTDDNIVYLIGFDTWKTTDGGQSWNNVSSGYHPDNHEVFVHPMQHEFLLRGNDGGLFYSNDGGLSWSHDEKLPITQFYTFELNELTPEIHGGGAQDNGTVITATGGTADWYSIWGGDGFHVLFDPVSGYTYAEYQYGGINTGVNGIDPNDRFNWNTPIEFNPQSYSTVFLGSNRLNVTYDQGNNWQSISPDLTDHSFFGYPITWGTITTLAMAPSDTNIIYCGTDDGNVWVTLDYGVNWQRVNPMSSIRWVTHVAVDPHNAAIVYATLSGYRFHDPVAHVYRSADFGQTWLSIDGNLPDVPCNDLVPDPDHDSTLFIATDVGVYVTLDLGQNWTIAGSNMPVVPVSDLRLHESSRTLYAASYGRSSWSLNIDPIFTSVPTTTAAKVSTVYPNPFHDQLFVGKNQFNASIEELEVMNMAGQVLLHVSVESTPGRIDLTTVAAPLSAGSYLLKIRSSEGVEIHHIVKMK